MDAYRAISHDSSEQYAQQDHSTAGNRSAGNGAPETAATELLGPPAANRHRLPDERPAITHHFSVGGHEGYLTVGLYPNGQPGEIFIRMAKEGSTIAGLMECFGTVVSVSLQHGVPLRVLCDKLSHTRFEPSGWTGNAELGYAKSIMDYLFRWLELRFLSGTQLTLFAATGNERRVPDDSNKVVPISSQAVQPGDGPACRSCGALMTPNGSCYTCRNCGGTSGCG
jgi:ribonucleoside-diphosphate reductase alpha chain